MPHLDDKGCCDCDCLACTVTQDMASSGEEWQEFGCICPDCNEDVCGLHHLIAPASTPSGDNVQ